MHCRSQHYWELLNPFAHHCQHARNNSQYCWRNNVGSCCVRLPYAFSVVALMGIPPFIYHLLHLHMHVEKMELKWSSSLKCIQITYIGKTKTVVSLVLRFVFHEQLAFCFYIYYHLLLSPDSRLWDCGLVAMHNFKLPCFELPDGVIMRVPIGYHIHMTRDVEGTYSYLNLSLYEKHRRLR